MSTMDSARPIGHRLVDIIRVVVTVTLGSIGAAAGFTHTHDWAAHHGQTGWLAWADAVVIEGLVIVAGFEVQRDHRAGKHAKVTFPLAVLVAGFGVQMAAQVALAEPTPSGWLVAAMPALGFLVVVKLLMRHTPEPPANRPAPEPAPGPEPVPAPAPPETAATTPASVSRLKLPPEIVGRIDTAISEAHTEGREVTAEDIRRAARIPDAMATQVLQQLGIHNGHAVP